MRSFCISNFHISDLWSILSVKQIITVHEKLEFSTNIMMSLLMNERHRICAKIETIEFQVISTFQEIYLSIGIAKSNLYNFVFSTSATIRRFSDIA